MKDTGWTAFFIIGTALLLFELGFVAIFLCSYLAGPK